MIKFVLDGKMDCSILAYKADVPLPRVPFPLLVRQESLLPLSVQAQARCIKVRPSRVLIHGNSALNGLF